MYIPYKPLSKSSNVVSFVPEELAKAQASCFAKLKYKDWDQHVADNLAFSSVDAMFQHLSAEQIDAVGLIIEQIKKKSGIILADETGVGKGRTLASIYRYCQKVGKKMLFFTYNKDLFSDFVRDLSDVGVDSVPKLHVLHNDVVVYNKAEEVVFKSQVKKNKQIIEDGVIDFDLVMSTYSQINSKTSKVKVNWLLKYCKNAVIVLDESHNAAGESNTRDNIESLIAASSAVVYASATFLKNEDEFGLYKKAIDNLDANNLKYLTSALEDENCEKLRSFFTAQMVREGKLIRREHEPLKTKWEHIRVSADEKIIDELSLIFNQLFEVIEATKEYEAVYEELKSAWFIAGNHINRVFKNVILLLKIDPLIVNIEKDLEAGLKPVIVMESTFASIIKNIISDTVEIDDEAELDERIYNISFKDYVTWIADKIILKGLPGFGLDPAIYEKIDVLHESIKSFDDSFATLSPIDAIRGKLAAIGRKSVEISGRDFVCINHPSGIEIKKIKKEPKTLLVNQFNAGTDVAVITRSGSTGFSMHNAPHFADKRTRVLYELEVSNRPQVRVQFIGRVRRKGQLTEPHFKTLVTNLAFEARLIEQQQQKMRVMHSHISTDANRLIGENIVDLYSTEADALAKQFLINWPSLAFKMGISLHVKYEALYFIDMILKRCIVLPQATCNKMYDYLMKGLEIEKTTDYLHNSSKILGVKPFVHNVVNQEEFRQEYAENKHFGINNIHYDWSGLFELSHDVNIKAISATELAASYATTSNIDSSHVSKLNKFFNYQMRSFYVGTHEKTLYQRALKLMPLIQKSAYVSFDSAFGRVFGYLHEVKAPESDFLTTYPTHYQVEIKILNHKSLPANAYLENSLKLDLNTLLMCQNLEVRTNKTVDFEKFSSVSEHKSQKFYAVLGNPIFVSYLQHIYKIGYIDYLLIEGKKVLALIISRDLNPNDVLNFRKPIFDVKDVINYALYTKKQLYTSPSELYVDNISVVPSTGGLNIEVISGYNNKQVFDVPMHRVLGSYNYKNGKKHYFVGYKQSAKVLAMLMKRGINFFK